MLSGSGLGRLTAPWGKSKGGVHPLICHLIDTAAVAEALYPILLGPYVRRELERAFRTVGSWPARSWVAVWCGLHDLGKLIPVFQAKDYQEALSRFGDQARPALDRVLPVVEARFGVDLKHGDATAAHMLERFQRSGMERSVAFEVARAIGDHHSYGQSKQKIRHSASKDQHLGSPGWARARDSMVEAMHRLWVLPSLSDLDWSRFRPSLPALVGLSGLTTISDWLASDNGRFARAPEIADADLDGYRDKAVETAEGVLDRLGWRSWKPPTGANLVPEFTDLFEGEPRELQRQVASFVEHRDRPGVLVIEAPTGEGKTKAALLAAAILVHRLGMSGLYVGMPTRATGEQKRRELNELLVRTGSSLRAVSAHSGAWKGESWVTPGGLAEDSSEQADERAEASEWFRRDAALAATLGVGTVDQALKAVFRARRSPMRLANLSGKVLVFDEVHTYDTYTSELLDRLLWWCGRLGIPVVLLSATLPAKRREELITEYRAGARGVGVERVEEPEAPAGWQLVWADEDVRERVPLTSALPIRKIKLKPMPDDDIPEWVMDQVADSGAAMLIYSTRKRAEASHERFQSAIEQHEKKTGRVIDLIHLDGETEDAERRERELRLEELIGRNGVAHRPLIVVGTSVLENLDLDADLVVSDICPTDLLIQRAGRLHRFPDRERPKGLRRPVLVLAGMARKRARARSRITFPGHIANVFGRAVLEASWTALEQHKQLELPDQVPDLVHRTYTEDQPLNQARKRQLAAADRDEFRAVTRCIPRCTKDTQFEFLTYQPGTAGPTRLERASFLRRKEGR